MGIAALTPSDLAILRGVDSPTLANAIERLDVRDRTSGYIGGRAQCRFPELEVMVGRALPVTMTSTPGAPGSRDGLWEMWQRLDELEGPSVIVVQDVSGEPDRVAYCGEIMATMGQRLGAVGMVTDGGVRDLDEVRALGFQYFAPFPVVSHGNFEVLSVGEPVTVYGQRIGSGDVLHGDANGVVVAPDCDPQQLQAQIDAVREREGGMLDYIRSDGFTVAGARERSSY